MRRMALGEYKINYTVRHGGGGIMVWRFMGNGNTIGRLNRMNALTSIVPSFKLDISTR